MLVRRSRRSRRLLAALAAAGLTLLVAGIPVAAGAENSPRELWVDQAASMCADTLTRDQVTRARPWCTIQAAATHVDPGDSVYVMPGHYLGPVQLRRPGSATSPTRFEAPEGRATIDAAGAAAALKLIGVHDVSFDGFTVTGAAGQGIYLDNASDITLAQLTVRRNGSYGIQASASRLTISDSTIDDNAMGGISELADSSGNVYRDNTISGNGHDGKPYNGDGIQLNGTSALVSGNTITDNGDPGIYEHGIYAGARSTNYVLESNTLAGNAASDIKAAGASGTVRYNRLGDSRLGLVLSDNAQPVLAYYNVIAGRFQHAVFFTTGTSPAQARVWNNTIDQTGSPDSRGDASAVFINSAALAEIKNNIICHANEDNRGAALFVNDHTQAGLTSNNNWFCSTDSSRRSLVLNGRRLTLRAWARTTGDDRASLSTAPAEFDSHSRVVSRNLGAGAGQPLGLTRDAAGVAVPAAHPNLGAFQ